MPKIEKDALGASSGPNSFFELEIRAPKNRNLCFLLERTFGHNRTKIQIEVDSLNIKDESGIKLAIKQK